MTFVKHRNGYMSVDLSSKFPWLLIATGDYNFPRAALNVQLAPHHMREWAHVLLRAADEWEKLYGETLPAGDVTSQAGHPIAVVGEAPPQSPKARASYIEQATKRVTD